MIEKLSNTTPKFKQPSRFTAGRRVMFLMSYSINVEGPYTVDVYINNNYNHHGTWNPEIFIRYNQGTELNYFIDNSSPFDGSSTTPTGLRFVRDYILEHWWCLLNRLPEEGFST